MQLLKHTKLEEHKWADVSVKDLGTVMRFVFEHQRVAGGFVCVDSSDSLIPCTALTGRKGAEHVSKLYSRKAVGELVVKRLAAIQHELVEKRQGKRNPKSP